MESKLQFEFIAHNILFKYITILKIESNIETISMYIL